MRSAQFFRTESQIRTAALYTVWDARRMALLSEKKTLTLAAAKKIAEAAESFATQHKWSVTIAVVDDGANLVYLEHMDGALLGTVVIAQQKARTSALFRCPTKDFETGLGGGATSLLKLDI